jgi:hypothetical protein
MRVEKVGLGRQRVAPESSMITIADFSSGRIQGSDVTKGSALSLRSNVWRANDDRALPLSENEDKSVVAPSYSYRGR